MVESKRIIDKNSIILIKEIPREILRKFADHYLKDHSYINSFKLSTEYLYNNYHLDWYSNNYNMIRKSLTHRFRFIIHDYIELGLIEKYNSHVYIKRKLN